MADYTYEGATMVPENGKAASMANWAGATVSLALVLGIGVWGYGVISRDVSGVPIVQAMSGPMREAPVDPGGRLADHQGLAVNQVAGHGAAARPADRLVLAPREAGLGEDDIATGLLAPQPEPIPPVQPATTPRMEPSLADNARLIEIEPTLPDPTEAPANAMAALIDQIAADAQPLTPLAPGNDVDVVTSVGESAEAPKTAPQPLPASGVGLTRSLKPRLRPAGLRSAAIAPLSSADAALVASSGAQSAVQEIAAADLAAGTRLVQIGAFDSVETARDEWNRLETRFGDFLEGKARVVQKASSGGRTFYRLRAHGFEDLADARRFCAAFVAQNVDCIPVVTR